MIDQGLLVDPEVLTDTFQLTLFDLGSDLSISYDLERFGKGQGKPLTGSDEDLDSRGKLQVSFFIVMKSLRVDSGKKCVTQASTVWAESRNLVGLAYSVARLLPTHLSNRFY